MTNHDLRVIQITDTHLRAQPQGRLRGADVDAGLTAVLDHIRRQHWPVDLILATGDLVHDEGVPAYERLKAWLEPLAVPVYCLPGNHDDPAAMNATLVNGCVRRERHVILSSWQFILLDSTVPGSTSGHLAEGELDFLRQTLVANPDLYTVVCLYHQPVAVGSAWLDTLGVDNGAALLASVEHHPLVRAVVWGHIHQAFAARRGELELVGTPSTCIQFKPGLANPEADDLPPGYRWFELRRDGILTTGVEWAASKPAVCLAKNES